MVSSPRAVLLAGGCRRSGLLPGVWVSPVRPLPAMPQLEHLLHDGYHGAGTEQSHGAELHVPLGQAGEQRESSCSGELPSEEQQGSLGVSSPCRGWAGQKAAVEE